MLRAKLYRLARSSERLRSRMMASGILESAGGSFVSTVHPNRNEKCGAGHCTKSKTGRIYAKRFGDLVRKSQPNIGFRPCRKTSSSAS